MKSIKETILKNPKITLDYEDFGILLDRIIMKNIDSLTKQNMHIIYRKLEGKKKTGINKSFLWLTLKEEYPQKKNLKKLLKIPSSTIRFWEKNGFPCLLFDKYHSFFEKFTKLEKDSSNEDRIYELLKKYFEMENKDKIIEILKNLSGKDIKIVKDFLIFRELKNEFKVNNRWIMYLCNRVESDPCKWSEKLPKIVENIILISQNKNIENKYKTKFNYNKRKNLLQKSVEDNRKVLKELKRYMGDGPIKRIFQSYNRNGLNRYLQFIKNPKTTKVSSNEVLRWERGIVNDSIKTLKKIHQNKFHKIDKKVLSRLFGWGLGDGGINKDNPRYYFICGKKEDLENINGYLKKNINSIKPVIRKNNSGGRIKGCDQRVRILKGKEDTYILYIRDSVFTRFLYGMGLPRGRKVLQKFNLPTWIKSGSRKVKKGFLNSIFECEGEKNTLYKRKTKICLKSPIFSLNKKVEYKENLISFLKEIINLFSEFGIQCKLDPKIKEGSIRKDGNITCSIRFWVKGSTINLINFSKVIDYRFNEEKKRFLDITIKECRNKLEKVKKQKDRYMKVQEMYNGGMTKNIISKELGLSHSTVSSWISGKIQPRLFDTSLEETL